MKKQYEPADEERRRRFYLLQQGYCDEQSYPCFIPEDCICEFCKKDLSKKISEKKAVTQFITSCPWCKRSFLE